MSGHNAFENLKHLATLTQSSEVLITSRQFEEWKRLYTFEGLRGIRYGQSFCNHFNITDYVLYYSLTPERADTYIIENYIERT